MQDSDVFETPPNEKDDDTLRRTSIQSNPPAICYRKNGLPAVIIIQQITKNSRSFPRKKVLKSSANLDDKNKAISSPKLEELTYIDENEVTVHNEAESPCQR